MRYLWLWCYMGVHELYDLLKATSVSGFLNITCKEQFHTSHTFSLDFFQSRFATENVWNSIRLKKKKKNQLSS